MVRGASALQFSPADPAILPQYSSAKDFLRYSQATFVALDMRKRVQSLDSEEAFLRSCELSEAEADGTLADVGSAVTSTAPVIGDAVVNGRPGILIVVNKLPWGNTLNVTRDVEAALADNELQRTGGAGKPCRNIVPIMASPLRLFASVLGRSRGHPCHFPDPYHRAASLWPMGPSLGRCAVILWAAHQPQSRAWKDYPLAIPRHSDWNRTAGATH